MSYFDDQMDAWFENDCQGTVEDTDPYDVPRKRTKLKKIKTTAGRSRSLLAISKIEEFAAWAVADGFTREPCKSTWEVLRLRWPNHHPYIFFTRGGAQHATSQAEGTQLVQRWLRSREEAERADNLS